jgi:PAS domain S-box-containing protein
LWIAHDISKERTINRYHQKAAEVFDALNDNYVELDHDLKFLYLNPKAEEFFGKAKEELIGHMLWEAFPQIIGTDLLQRILETGEKKQRSSGEFISPTKNRWLYVSMAPTVDGIVITFFDIQEIKEANLRLEEEHRRLKKHRP